MSRGTAGWGKNRAKAGGIAVGSAGEHARRISLQNNDARIKDGRARDGDGGRRPNNDRRPVRPRASVSPPPRRRPPSSKKMPRKTKRTLPPSALETAMLPSPWRATTIEAKRLGKLVPAAETEMPITWKRVSL